MAMDSSHPLKDVPSLLPYLQGNQGYANARCCLIFTDQTVADSVSPPWLIDDSNPLARLVEGAFISDTGCSLKKVLLLVQRDRYSINDDFWPGNNLDVEKSWQRSFSAFKRADNNNQMVVLSVQDSRSGGLNLLSPLFYCREKKVYFHPPCPRCGHPLQLCEDDAILVSSGLLPYSTSLKRYLYCEPCTAQVPSDFYTYECDHTDPPDLKDRWALMNEFGLLRKSMDTSGPFPCIQCPSHEECYGPDPVYRSRIIPFSFYPFYLLIFEACTLHSFDYLQLISGAQFSDIEQQLDSVRNIQRINSLKRMKMDGQHETSLFPKHDDRYFLEILYLKLTFLADAFNNFLLYPDLIDSPDIALPIEDIWVQLFTQTDTFPLSWNFRTRIIAIAKPPAARKLFPEFHSTIFLVQFGLLLFNTLIVNGKHDAQEISRTLHERYLDTDKLFSGAEADPVFIPENIFWHPDKVKVNPCWLPFWEKVLNIGLALLRAGIHDDLQRSSKSFLESLEAIRSEVKNALFGDIPSELQMQVQSDRQVKNDELYGIIIKIRDKWHINAVNRSSSDPREQPETVMAIPEGKASPQTVQNGNEFIETVILNTGSPGKGKQEAPHLVHDVQFFHETVTLVSEKWTGVKTETSTDEGDRTVFIKPRTGESVEDDGLAKTSVRVKSQIKQFAEDDSLAKTNILAKPQIKQPETEDSLAKTSVQVKSQIKQFAEDDSLAKTNILAKPQIKQPETEDSLAKTSIQANPPSTQFEADDSMAKTSILPPKSSKEK